jgi:hypothetical protein
MTGSAYKFGFTLYAYFLFTRLQSDRCNCQARIFFSGTLVALNNALKADAISLLRESKQMDHNKELDTGKEHNKEHDPGKEHQKEKDPGTGYNKGKDPGAEHLKNNTPKDTGKH